MRSYGHDLLYVGHKLVMDGHECRCELYELYSGIPDTLADDQGLSIAQCHVSLSVECALTAVIVLIALLWLK